MSAGTKRLICSAVRGAVCSTPPRVVRSNFTEIIDFIDTHRIDVMERGRWNEICNPFARVSPGRPYRDKGIATEKKEDFSGRICIGKRIKRGIREYGFGKGLENEISRVQELRASGGRRVSTYAGL
ncbi:hypothetical protein EVAR_79847_1 [Eumeta japonica]|uniref:Uncharacterized protein n=1 Tax=Eumeta variegata TaxID=151549 RepID=A0A4C1TZ89_EUMVA|nr:hypothetical protein EVAR_79847_1 [Eumeta japonica]